MKNFFAGGGQAISESLKSALNDYLKEKSTVAANRLIRNFDLEHGEDHIPVRYLSENKTMLYRNFSFKNHLSKSTFLKYLKSSRIFKNPCR